MSTPDALKDPPVSVSDISKEEQPSKEDLTTKDITNLYNSLQSVIDKVPSSNDKPADSSFIPLPSSLPMSPSSSSPMSVHYSVNQTATPRSSNEKSSECPCHHIMESKDSVRCALCDRVIPILEEIQNEKQRHEHELEQLQSQLTQEQDLITQQLDEIGQLSSIIRTMEQEMEVKTKEFQSLQNDMEQLNDKYVDEIERVAEIQHSKDMVESELEDLSRRLFEEANGMVANEKREKYNLEVAQRHLENELRDTRERLSAEQMQLKELRQKMQEMQAHDALEGSTLTGGEDGADGQYAASVVDHMSTEDLSGILPGRRDIQISMTNVDNLLLDEFGDFVNAGTTVPLKKLHSIAFMKYCQLEDVEPCLRFGPNSRLSARKINDAIVMNTCFIEETPTGFLEEQAKRPADIPLKISASKSLIWERFSSNAQTVFNGCQACGRNDGTPLPYRFRISYFDDWACIDRFCRDRLVAVCEYYVFIRNIRQGYYNGRSIPELYREAIRLRLQMFYARMGALPWTLRKLGVKDDTVGIAPSPKMAIPPPMSESSPLPRSVAAESPRLQPKRRGSAGVVPETDNAPPPTADTL